MDIDFDYDRLLAAYDHVKADLRAEQTRDGHWVGELSTSALSTATAVSALAIVERNDATNDSGHFANEMRESFLSELIVDGINWLASHQNADGGWGDTDKSDSNIATTMLVVAAFHLTGVPVKHADALERAQKYIDDEGGIEGLKKRYGKDKTFAVPILTNYALAELIPWSKVPALPFEFSCLPQSWYRWLRLPVVSYAIPALVAIGQCRFYHLKPWNFLLRMIRTRCVEPSLEMLQQLQPASGGFLEAIPLTSFVVMSLASSGRVRHPVTQRGLEFIVESVREDGSWPIDTDLATWNTTLAVNALASAGEDPHELGCLDWLLACQNTEPHPYTGAEAGGWGWSDLSGAVPDADDTAGALLSLAHLRHSKNCSTRAKTRISKAATNGTTWLLNLQNNDGGWPTFCRGWGALPFDRSGADLTAHALRALHAWREEIDSDEYASAFECGLQYLLRQQRDDGSWAPLWFGNQNDSQEENPVYGTAKVLLALAAVNDFGSVADSSLAGSSTSAVSSPSVEASPSLTEVPKATRRAVKWLVDHQDADGGWGGKPRSMGQKSATPKEKQRFRSSVEETALAVNALLVATQRRGQVEKITLSEEISAQSIGHAIEEGLKWLVTAVEGNRHKDCSPIGFYFAKLWYYEKLYPITFTASTLGQAVGPFASPALRKAEHTHR